LGLKGNKTASNDVKVIALAKLNKNEAEESYAVETPLLKPIKFEEPLEACQQKRTTQANELPLCVASKLWEI